MTYDTDFTSFDDAVEAADVPRPDVKASQKDAHAAWLVVGTDRALEVAVVRAVLRGVLTAEQVRTTHALGGDAAVRGLVEGVGCATWA